MDDLDGCGLTILAVAACLLTILAGFLFHIGWNVLGRL
jgi:hypothetical protein